MCVCSHVTAIDNRCRITVLQHPRERLHPFGTARFARLALTNAAVVLARGGGSNRLHHWLPLPPGTGLLYPSPTAQTLERVATEELPTSLVVPETFDITRTPNHHLSFSQGAHFCLGAQLARMEIKVAVNTLLERSPNLHLAVPREEIEMQAMPLWHRVQGLPVVVG